MNLFGRKEATRISAIGADLAGDGSDRSVVMGWVEGPRGGQARILVDEHKADLGVIADKVALIWNGSMWGEIGYDAVGLGFGFDQMLIDRGIPKRVIRRFLAGARAEGGEAEELKYENLATQVAVMMRARIAAAPKIPKGPGGRVKKEHVWRRENLVIEEKPELRRQLNMRKFKVSLNNRMQLQPKSEMTESPDYYDSLLITFYGLMKVAVKNRYELPGLDRKARLAS